MPSLASRPYAGPPDLLPLVHLARRNTAAREPGWTYYHPGDITWQLATLPANDFVRLWEVDGVVAGFATFEPPGVLAFDIDARSSVRGDITDAIIAWGTAMQRDLPSGIRTPIAYGMLDHLLSTEVMGTDAERIADLESRGFRRVDRGGVRFRLDLAEPVPEARIPPGMRIRYATDADINERTELHRDAWSVWGVSTFSAGRYRRLRDAPMYDETLDVVLDDGSGRLLSYCVCWADLDTGIATFEPIGTRPAVAGRGLGRATIRAALHLLRERGMRWATVSTASVNAAAMDLYRSAGFATIGHSHYYARRAEGPATKS